MTVRGRARTWRCTALALMIWRCSGGGAGTCTHVDVHRAGAVILFKRSEDVYIEEVYTDSRMPFNTCDGRD